MTLSNSFHKLTIFVCRFLKKNLITNSIHLITIDTIEGLKIQTNNKSTTSIHMHSVITSNSIIGFYFPCICLFIKFLFFNLNLKTFFYIFPYLFMVVFFFLLSHPPVSTSISNNYHFVNTSFGKRKSNKSTKKNYCVCARVTDRHLNRQIVRVYIEI